MLAISLQGVALKKLNNEISEMEINYENVEAAFPKLNRTTINNLVDCTGEAWENLLKICVSCPGACVSNKNDYCLMFDDKSYYG